MSLRFLIVDLALLVCAVACGGGAAGPAGSTGPAEPAEHTHGAHGDHGDHAQGHQAHMGGEHGHEGKCSSAAGAEGCARHDHDHDHDHADGAPTGHTGHGMSHGFKDADKWAKVFDDPARDAWQRPDEIVALLSLRPGMTVADVGAGTGYFVGRLSAGVGATGAVIATDLEDDMVKYLEARATREGWKNVRPLRVQPADPGLTKASVDRVLIVDVWHHLGDRRAYAAKLAAALRPGGRIAVVDFELSATMGPPREHRLAPEVIAEELRSAGLTVELAKESLPQQYVVIGTAPAR